MNELIFTFPQRYGIHLSFTKKIGNSYVFITMEQTLKIIHKLLDNFIIPKFEEEIVYECHNLLKYYDLPNLKLSFTFTTDGENFYVYN